MEVSKYTLSNYIKILEIRLNKYKLIYKNTSDIFIKESYETKIHDLEIIIRDLKTIKEI